MSLANASLSDCFDAIALADALDLDGMEYIDLPSALALVLKRI